MTKATKYVITSACLCVFGAICLELALLYVGWSCVSLGVFGMIVGPSLSEI